MIVRLDITVLGQTVVGGCERMPQPSFKTCIAERSPHRFVIRAGHLNADEQIFQPTFSMACLSVTTAIPKPLRSCST